MLRIPAPTAQDRANQWSDAYNAAEALFAPLSNSNNAFLFSSSLFCPGTKVFKDCPQHNCNVKEAFLDIVCEAIAARHSIPFQIIVAAVLTVANDLHEQYHNPA